MTLLKKSCWLHPKALQLPQELLKRFLSGILSYSLKELFILINKRLFRFSCLLLDVCFCCAEAGNFEPLCYACYIEFSSPATQCRDAWTRAPYDDWLRSRIKRHHMEQALPAARQIFLYFVQTVQTFRSWQMNFQ